MVVVVVVAFVIVVLLLLLLLLLFIFRNKGERFRKLAYFFQQVIPQLGDGDTVTVQYHT